MRVQACLTMLSRAVALLCVGLALTSALEEMVMKPRREVDVKHRAHQRFVKLRAEHKKAQEEEAEGVEVGAMSALEEDEPKAQAKSSAPYVPPMMPMLNPMPMMMARAKAVALAAAPTNGASISLLEANKPLQAAEAGKPFYYPVSTDAQARARDARNSTPAASSVQAAPPRPPSW